MKRVDLLTSWQRNRLRLITYDIFNTYLLLFLDAGPLLKECLKLLQWILPFPLNLTTDGPHIESILLYGVHCISSHLIDLFHAFIVILIVSVTKFDYLIP